MSIEENISYIAKSLEWQNKLLAAIFLNNNSDGCDDESKFENDQSSDNDVLSE